MARNVCRKCRLQKCFEVGMLEESMSIEVNNFKFLFFQKKKFFFYEFRYALLFDEIFMLNLPYVTQFSAANRIFVSFFFTLLSCALVFEDVQILLIQI